MRRAIAKGERRARLPPAQRTPPVRRAWRQTAAVALSTWAAIAGSDVYRYQDEHGGWHFTDTPPAGVEADRILDIWETAKPHATPPVVDLTAQLEGSYDPITPIARATLAVVAVKSPFGEASGFFCSDDGHILTDQHLVRPAERKERAQREHTRADEGADLRAMKEQLQASREQVAIMEKDLAGYQRVRERAKDDSSRQWAQEAHDRLLHRYRSEQKKLNLLSGNLRTIGKDLEPSSGDLDRERTNAALATSFDIRLKDGTELAAELIASGEEQDLALLKIDGFRTPHLRLGATPTLSRGQRVYAIGSARGMQDTVTSGVITEISGAFIYTDAQILSGSSGGPLITESGILIGINVAANPVSGESPYRAGFGKSIPVQAALHAFSDALGAEQGSQISTPVIEAIPPSPVPEGGFTWE